jgi:acyl-CoA thioester hydrolase
VRASALRLPRNRAACRCDKRASPARLDDAVLIASRPTELRAASCRLHQQARRGDTLLAEAHLRVGFIGPDGRPRRQPDAWRAAFATLINENETA